MRHRVDVPDKVKRLSGLSVPEDGLTATYAGDCGLTFFKEVGIGVGILGAIPLRYTYTYNGADGLGGITINLFDDGGSQVAGTIDLTLHGFQAIFEPTP